MLPDYFRNFFRRFPGFACLSFWPEQHLDEGEVLNTDGIIWKWKIEVIEE